MTAAFSARDLLPVTSGVAGKPERNQRVTSRHNHHALSVWLEYTQLQDGVSVQQKLIIIVFKVKPVWNVLNVMQKWKKSPTVET